MTVSTLLQHATLGKSDHSGTSATALVRAAVKTANYTAAANELVPVDTTSGGVTVTLPTAPADKTQVAVKHIVQGGTNVVTVARGGTAVFNKVGGSTTLTLPLVNQAAVLEYDAATGIWTVLSDDLPLGALDARFVADLFGSGSPEGAVTATVGLIYRDTTNGYLFVKRAGTGNIGWQRMTWFGAAPQSQPWQSGRYYVVPNIAAVTTDNAMGNSTARYVPFWVPVGVNINRIGCEVQAATAAAADIARTANDAVTTNGSQFVASTTAAFVATNVGMPIAASGIAANTVIIATTAGAAAWAVGTTYAVGQIRHPVTPNGHSYMVTVAGTSNLTTEPTWPTDGSTVVDGTLTWKDVGTVAGVAISNPATATASGVTITIGPAVIRLGIYADDGTGRPGTLILDAGVSGAASSVLSNGLVSAASATVQEVTVNQDLPAGVYWVAQVVQGVTTTQPTMRVSSAAGIIPNVDMGTTTPAAGGANVGMSQSAVTGPLANAGAFSTSGKVPRVFVKVNAPLVS